MRRQAGEKVRDYPELFEAELVDMKMDANDYLKHITNDDNWGGAIDILATALDYLTEISVVSLPDRSVQTFGTGKDFEHRVFILYDGKHYDALYQKIPKAMVFFHHDKYRF